MSNFACFFDRCCPRRLAYVIKAYEEDYEVRFLDDDARFEKTATDEEWMTTLSQDTVQWIVVSADAKILRKQHQLALLKQSQLYFFLLGKAWQRMDIHEKCCKLLKVWPDIIRTATQKRHRIYEVLGGQSLKIEEIH